jgi:hypothetical protein
MEPHEGLDCKTPAEVCGISIVGENGKLRAYNPYIFIFV